MQQQITNSLQVITPTLLHSQMSVDTDIARCARQFLPLIICTVLSSLHVNIRSREAKVHHMQNICLLPAPHQEILRLDVPVQHVLAMNLLHSQHELLGEHQHRLHAKSAATACQKLLQRLSQQVHNHDIVAFFCARPMHVGNARCPGQASVYICLVQDLWMSQAFLLEFECHLDISLQIDASIDSAISPCADPLTSLEPTVTKQVWQLLMLVRGI
mmetsp:Transcript_119845/g.220410  ORF Transcript_119845/g.220410 Transcript_119845/m.220410 type:complete len:215 (-) Transcript_119845:18-662(-)